MKHHADLDVPVTDGLDHRDTATHSRVCVVCGSSLATRRSDAIYCGGPCRAEAARLRAILSGKRGQKYESLVARLAASRRRTQTRWRPLWCEDPGNEQPASLALRSNRSHAGPPDER